MIREIMIDGTGHVFKASGATPRIYRGICGRDLLQDILKLDSGEYTPETLQIYEDLAYTMARQGNDSLAEDDERKDHKFPLTPDEWLDTIEVMDIYDVLPQIARMWHDSQGTSVTAKKNKGRQREQ